MTINTRYGNMYLQINIKTKYKILAYENIATK